MIGLRCSCWFYCLNIAACSSITQKQAAVKVAETIRNCKNISKDASKNQTVGVKLFLVAISRLARAICFIKGRVRKYEKNPEVGHGQENGKQNMIRRIIYPPFAKRLFLNLMSLYPHFCR